MLASDLPPSEARKITANIVRLLEKKCVHLDGRDPAWQRLFEKRESGSREKRVGGRF